MSPVVAAGSGVHWDPGRNSSARTPAPPGSARQLIADLAAQHGNHWYQEALQFAQAFNRRPLIARQAVPYNEMPPGY